MSSSKGVEIANLNKLQPNTFTFKQFKTMTLQEATHIINNSKDYTQEQKDQAREVIVEACMQTHENPKQEDPTPYESWDEVKFLYY